MQIINKNLLVTTCLVFAFVNCLVETATSGQQDLEHPTKAQFKLPTLFDFNYFKEVFNRHYTSFVENLNRQKLYLARAINAFASAIDYKHGKASSYLVVNQFSDWTLREIENLFNRSPGRLESEPTVLEEVSKHFTPNIEAVEEKLAQLPVEEIADNLNLEREPRKTFERSDKVPSNNPNYEPVELTSYGLNEPDEEHKEIPAEDSIAVDKIFTVAVEEAADLLNTDSTRGKKSVEEAKPELEQPKSSILVDHRDSGCFFEPREQKGCGACFAFGVIALFEWFHCRETGKKVAFSEQYVVDCAKGRVDHVNGCEGGAQGMAIYFSKLYGLELRDNYPYRARQDLCPYAPWTNPKSMGYMRVDNKEAVVLRPENLTKDIMEAPILVHLFMSLNILFWGGGVDENKNCEKKFSHTMVFVGLGVENGKEYMIARNSWGNSWGQNGHYKISVEAVKRCVELGLLLTLAREPKNPQYSGEELLKTVKMMRDSGKDVGIAPLNVTSPAVPTNVQHFPAPIYNQGPLPPNYVPVPEPAPAQPNYFQGQNKPNYVQPQVQPNYIQIPHWPNQNKPVYVQPPVQPNYHLTPPQPGYFPPFVQLNYVQPPAWPVYSPYNIPSKTKSASPTKNSK